MNRFQLILVQLLTQYRKQTLIGAIGAGGAVVTFAAVWVLLYVVFAPPIPDPKVSTVEEVATFLSHKRGLARLPIPQRKKVFIETMAYYTQDPVRREQLATRIERMAPSDRAVIRDAVLEIGKDEFVNDAEQFRKLPEQEKERFVEKRLDAYEALRKELRGQRGGTNIGESFANDPGMPTKPDQWTKVLVSRTTARERAMAEPYANKIADVLEKRKKQSSRSRRSGSRNAG